jgi:hypothetical protein
VAVRVLDAELAEAVRRVVDRVVDAGAALLDLVVERVAVVAADVDVPHLVDDPPVRDEARGVLGEREQQCRALPIGGREVRRVAVGHAAEAELVAVVGDRALEVGDEQHG